MNRVREQARGDAAIAAVVKEPNIFAINFHSFFGDIFGVVDVGIELALLDSLDGGVFVCCSDRLGFGSGKQLWLDELRLIRHSKAKGLLLEVLGSIGRGFIGEEDDAKEHGKHQREADCRKPKRLLLERTGDLEADDGR